MIQTSLGSLLALNCGNLSHEPPNIVLLILDALRAKSLPMYGCPRNTAPFLKQLSEKSILFERCYASSTWTAPAVASILTGLLPSEHNVAKIRKSLPSDVPSLPKKLKKVGYHTGYFTNNSVIADGFGMEAHFDHADYETFDPAGSRSIVKKSIQWIGGLEGENGPFFSYIHLLPPHIPYNPPQPFLQAMREENNKHNPSNLYLEPYMVRVDSSLGSGRCEGRFPSSVTLPWNHKNPLFYRMRYEANILFGDSLISAFMGQLQKLGLSRRTLFIITSDHGECFGEKGHATHGETLNNAILHVPLIIHDSTNSTSKVESTPVSHYDFGTTLLAQAGSDEIVGDYGWDILSTEVKVPKDRILISQEIPTDLPTEKGWAITQGKWRFVYNDFPWYGNTRLLRVLMGEALPYHNNTIPLAIPDTAINTSQAVANNVVLESFGIHSPIIEYDQEYQFSGSLRLYGAKGILLLNAIINGEFFKELRQYICESNKVDFFGKLPAIEYDENIPRKIIQIEAVWKPFKTKQKTTSNSDSDNRKVRWRLVSFPIYHPIKISTDLLFIGMDIKPSIGLAGENLLITYTYHYLKHQEQDRLIKLELVNGDGEEILTHERIVFGKHRKNRGQKREQSILKDHRTYDWFWLPLPQDLPKGTYRLRLRLCSIKVTADHQRTIDYERVECNINTFYETDLQIEASMVNQLRGLLQYNDPISYACLGSEIFINEMNDTQNLPLLKRFYYLYPNEGHVQYLMSQLADKKEDREKHLKRCLTLTPFHREALKTVYDEEWGEKFQETIEQITPPHALPYTFQNIIKFLGYDLQKAPNNEPALYLTLYWEALAKMDKPFSGKLMIVNKETNEHRPEYSLWFLGGHIRPTYSWKIGESLNETLYVPLDDDMEEVELIIEVGSYWDYIFSGWVDLYNLLAHNESNNEQIGYVSLGRFKIPEIPVSEKDLKVYKRTDSSFYQLYDLEEDAGEKNNLIHQRPDIRKDLIYKMTSILEKGRVSLSPSERVLSSQMEERMRALGYL